MFIFCETARPRRFSVIFAKVQWHICDNVNTAMDVSAISDVKATDDVMSILLMMLVFMMMLTQLSFSMLVLGKAYL